MNIGIGCPSPESVPAEFALDNLPGIIAYSKNHLAPTDNIYISYQMGVRTDRNRNIILKRFLDGGIDLDYILWLDVDMLYPHDIIMQYLAAAPFDVIGCLYFKRAESFEPVGYVKGSNPKKPYIGLDPRSVDRSRIYEVDGLGFGGMMVNMKVYNALGEDKWHQYSPNYHLPESEVPRLTHDLYFCKTVQEHGFKVLLHGNVRPGHLMTYPVTEDDYIRNDESRVRQGPTINVLMPTIHPKKAKKTAKILKIRAGMDCNIIVLKDKEKKGYVATINQGVKDHPADYYVYLTDEEFPCRNWLKLAYDTLIEKKAGLLGFNDGKWNGDIACVGLISHEFMIENYVGNLFFPGYFGHYNDTELTMIALQKGKYCYDPKIVLMEIDYDKESKSVNPEDLKLFHQRKSTNFDGLVTDSQLHKKYQ